MPPKHGKQIGELISEAEQVVVAYRELEKRKSGPSRMTLKEHVEKLELLVSQLREAS